MFKNKLIMMIAGILFAMMVSSGYAYQAFRGPTELIHWDKNKAFNGYTMLSPRLGDYTFLIDMEGNVVHTWPKASTPQLLENGHVLGRARNNDRVSGFKEFDWDGKVAWEYYDTRKSHSPHHDHERIFNKKLNAYTTIYISNKSLSHDEVITAGADPSRSRNYEGAQMDTIVEVDMDGNIVWEWWAFNHLVQDIDPSKENYVGAGNKISYYPGRLDINWGKTVRRDWLHFNSLDHNEKRDQIVVNTVDGEFYVIDHGNTFIPGDPDRSIALAAGPRGDFMYRFGDPARHGQGEKPSYPADWNQGSLGDKQIGSSHSSQWVDDGCPGAGNFLVFDNGRYVFGDYRRSSVVEINPYLDLNKKNTGHYVNPPDAGYFQTNSVYNTDNRSSRKYSNQVVWWFSAREAGNFYAGNGGGCQRLPNGNTIIMSGYGHTFEVTPGDSQKEPEVVWEYINPLTIEGPLKYITKDYINDEMALSSFNAFRFGPGHPAFKGRNLRPKGLITELFARGELEQYQTQEAGKGKGGKGKRGKGKGGKK